MNRRAFIGGLLGTVAATAMIPHDVPFFARPDTAEWQRVGLPYRLLFRDRLSGLTLQAPAVVEAKIVGQKLCCRAELLTAETFVVIDRTVLLTDTGRVLDDTEFSPIYMEAGDMLAVDHEINIKGPIDEVLSEYVSVRERIRLLGMRRTFLGIGGRQA